jgi:large subunit ribosomal protein L24
MNRLKKGDEIIVISGKDKGKRGKIVRLAADMRCVVEGINIIKKHKKGNPNKGDKGGIIEQAAPIHVSNVMLYNAQTGKGSRVGFKVQEDGSKTRYFKTDGSVIQN